MKIDGVLQKVLSLHQTQALASSYARIAYCKGPLQVQVKYVLLGQSDEVTGVL